MRLDLFLKTCRLVKRRTIAREMCDNHRVLVNDRKAKPAREVKLGDIVTLRFVSRIVRVEIIGERTGRPNDKNSLDKLFRVISETRLPHEKELWPRNLS